MLTARGAVLCALAALVCLLGCQSLLGDFEIDTVQGGGDTCEGRFRCSESWLYCENESDGSWTQIDSCGTADQCDSDLGRCTVCDSGDYRCNGAKLETCKADRTGWTVVQTCTTADECNLNSRSCRACTPGETPMCAGVNQTELRQCGDDQAWQTRDTCATKELCAATVEAAVDPNWDGSCIAPGCPAAGAYVCDGENLFRCPPGLTGYVLVDTCATAELCASTAADPTLADSVGGKCVTPVCSPAGAYRCTGDALEQCLDDQLGWGLVETCVPPLQCNTNEQTCAGPCEPGDRQCSGATLELCDEGRLWQVDQPCVSGPLCQVTEDPLTGEWTGTCLEPACPEPGAFRCTESLLERCSPDQTEWQLVDTCASGALCRELDGRCEMPRCAPGELRCNAENPSELLRCRDDLTDWESSAICSSTQSCNTDPAGPPCLDQCPDPPLRCNGAARESCTGVSGMPEWTTVTTCRSRELCQCAIDGTCSATLPPDDLCGAPVCGELLGGSRCEGSKLQLCLQGRNGFDEGVECGSSALCVRGQPAMPGPYFDGGYCAACSVASETSCNGSTLRTCSADRRNWASTTPCGALGCRENGTNDYCNECTNGARRCVGSGATAGVQTCELGRWSAAATCTAGFGCVNDGDEDRCAVCLPDHRQCVGGSIQTCNAQSNWGPTTACAPGLGCTNSGNADYCTECVAGDRRCDAAGLQSCAQGKWGTPSACTLGCYDATGNTDYCFDCTNGEQRCDTDDAGLQTCAQNRWSDAVACTLGCRDNPGTADYCAECTGTETRCGSGGLQTCSAQQWGSAAACALGCVTADGDDYCAECTGTETRCSSGGLQTCSAQQWGSAAACAFGCVTDDGDDYCGECTPGETQCVEASLRTCGTDSRWTAMACALACVENETVGAPDYCAVCDLTVPCPDGSSCLLGLCVPL